MAKMALVPVAELEPGMKLASAVVSATGQTLLTSGILLDETHIDFLRRRGIQKVHVTSTKYASKSAAYEEALDKIETTGADLAAPPPESVDVSNIDPGGPTVTLDRMPAETPPADAPTKKDVDTGEIEKSQTAWRADRTAREKKLEKKHGESYKKVVKALGEPIALSSQKKFQPARLFSEAVKDVTQDIFLEKSVNEKTLDMLTRNITAEIITRQGMSTLLSRAQAAGEYLLAHMVNVGVYSMYMAIQMELTSEEITNTAVGGLLSDIGMLSMPERFWVHNRELWKKEKDMLVTHPGEGRRMIRDCPGSTDLWAKLAMEHHERLDGSGYPNGLKASDLDIFSRIVQIADTYSAATADRAYRDAYFPDEALRQMVGRPKMYDRSLVEIFCQLVGFYPEGYIVLLSSGEQATVLKTNPKNVFRPIIRLSKDKNGRPLPPAAQSVVDLTGRPDLRVVKVLEDDSVNWV